MGESRAELSRRGRFWEHAANLPNLLTVARILAIPFVLWFMSDGTRAGNVCAVLIYAFAAVTDAVDGWLARRRGLTSVLGKFLDPLADKLIVVATLVLMVELGRVAAWPVIIIIVRDFCVTGLRTIAMSEGVVISASRGGKDKTALQNVAVSMLILHDTYDLDFGFFAGTANFNAIGLVMLYVSVLFAVTSAVSYGRAFFVQEVGGR